jgi:arylsulfatase A-like enzyme
MPRDPSRPNVLLIMTDQQRADGLGAAGNPVLRTPHMDRLAAEGIRCACAVISNPFCMPSRATVLTGRYAHAHRCWDNGVALPADTLTLAHRFAEHGYHTASRRPPGRRGRGRGSGRRGRRRRRWRSGSREAA